MRTRSCSRRRPRAGVRPALGALAALGLGLSLGGTSPAHASGFSCGNRVVTDGMTSGEVRAVCGEPAEVTSRPILRRPMVWRHGRPYVIGDGQVEVVVETWIYNFGPTRLMRKLRFDDGVLQDIETLGYGYYE